LVALSRREFCGLGVGLGVGLALVGCTDGSLGVVQTGPLGAGDDDGMTDASMSSPDGSTTNPPDAPQGSTCGTGALDVGAASSFVTGTPKYFSNGTLFVARDAGGLYALTARCTHEGKTCTIQSQQFYCPRHGARFTFNGAVVSGPVSQPLKHFAMCTLANGNVGVLTNQTVSATTRLVV